MKIAKTWSLLVIALFLSALVVQNGIANIYQESNPRIALAVSRSARAQANLAATLAAEGGSERQRAIVLAQSAVRQNPVLPLPYLAMALSGTKGERAANMLIDYSERLSRRYLAVQLWKIEQSVASQDVAGAMLHYDIALRTVVTAPALLFPVLIAATANAALIEPFAQRLALRPQWSEAFLEQAIARSPAPANVALLMRRSAELGAPPSEGLDVILITRLVANQQFDAARSVYQRRFAKDGFPLIRNGSFDRISHQTSLEWIFVDEGSHWARIGNGDDRNPRLDFGTTPGRGGPVASQLLTLSPGRYRLSLRMGDQENGAAVAPVIHISCATAPGAELLAAPLLISERPTKGSWLFSVPVRDCPAQSLSLVVDPNEAGDTSAWLDDVSIKPEPA